MKHSVKRVSFFNYFVPNVQYETGYADCYLMS